MKITIVLSILISLSALLISQAAGSSVLPLSGEKMKQISSITNETMLNCKAPGLLLGIWQDDKEPYILTKGYSSLIPKKKINAEDTFRIGSMTKTFTATVILQLVDEKLLSLDDKLSKYITTVPNADKITIRQLLNMTSGVPDAFANKTFSNWVTRTPETPRSPYDIYYFTATGKPQFEPGKECIYSNSNYFILGLIIEQLTNKTPRQAITERVIDKLNLKHTFYPVTTNMPKPYMKGYFMGTDGKIAEAKPVSPSITGTTGAMISNMEDMALYVKTLYNGSLISKEMNAERQKWNRISGMTEIYSNGSLVVYSYGLGLFNIGGGIGHGGMVNGYSCGAYYFPEKDTTIVMVINNLNVDDFSKSVSRVCEVLFDYDYPFGMKDQ